MIQRLFWAVLAATSLSLGGCGGSDETPLRPGDQNPFRALVAGTDSTLDVATWNLHGFAASAGTETVDLVADAITAMALDVVALQEVAQASRFNELIARLPGWEGYRAPSGGEWSLAYLWRTDTVTLVADAYEIFPDLGSPFPRAPLILDFTYDGQSVLVINNHLKCCGNGDLELDDPNDEETRRFIASGLLADWIASEAADRAVVLVGDLNDRLNDPRDDNVFQMFLDQPASYRFTDWDIAVDSSRAQWSWGPGQSHLDHILVTDELFAAIGRCLTVRLDLALASGEFADKISDHAPVVVTLDLTAR